MRKRFAVLLHAASMLLSARAAFAATPAFANQRDEVTREYESIASSPRWAARMRFRELDASMRRDVFILHLTVFMEQHPELTTDQRGVIYEAIGLLASGTLEDDTPESARALQRLVTLARGALGEAMTRYSIGGTGLSRRAARRSA
jgi:hypothetical protein